MPLFAIYALVFGVMTFGPALTHVGDALGRRLARKINPPEPTPPEPPPSRGRVFDQDGNPIPARPRAAA